MKIGLGMVAAGALVLASLTTVAQAASTPTTHPQAACGAHGPKAQVGRFGGIAHAVPRKGGCAAMGLSDGAIGTPPLLFHGGPVMGTASTGPVVLTPIYWNPTGRPIPASYKSLINQYLSDVAAASNTHVDVYSTLTEYYGSNGSIRYRVAAASAIDDTNPLPASGCTVTAKDGSGIYADGSGYDACLSDNQLTTEIDSVVSARGLPRDLAHMYVLFLPQHVESCFYGGSTATGNNFCTINHERSTAYCAYHSQTTQGTVYANMPWPIYNGPTVLYTCSSDASFDQVQSPNNNPDADTEISPTSHEIMEAVTDPDTATGWYDSSGYENGDECAYVYGSTQGTAGALYNQTIRKHHYLTQEEFSNADFARTGGGCLPYE